MSVNLIGPMTKAAIPDPPGEIVNQVACASGSASVPVELTIVAKSLVAPCGVNIVFIIDESGSMDSTDPEQYRHKALLDLAVYYEPTREGLDRIAIITFNGDKAKLMSPNSPWKTWSETGAAVEELVDITPEGATPMASAMHLANNLLDGSGGAYRLAVLITDGGATVDSYTDTPKDTIMYELVPDAVSKRVIYSTISVMDESDFLLAYIATQTDYISPTSGTGEPSPFYLQHPDVETIADVYTVLFVAAMNRAVAQMVRIDEKLDDHLRVDPLRPLEIYGPGWDDDNLLGTTPASVSAQFTDTGRLIFDLKELEDSITLRFYVKLRPEAVTPQDSAAGYIDVDVDDSASKLSYLNPTEPLGAQTVQLPFPQTRIRFWLGVFVEKSLDQSTDQVRIALSNSDIIGVQWAELAEVPSWFVQAEVLEDQFDFHPFSLLLSNRIRTWFVNQCRAEGNFTEQTVLEIYAGWERACSRLKTSLHDVFDEDLGRFNVPGGGVSSALCSTKNQRGYYRLSGPIGPMEERLLKLKVSGISHYGPKMGASGWFAAPVDAISANNGLSEYRVSKPPFDWRQFESNPLFTQYCDQAHSPDLYVRNCFDYTDLPNLKALFVGFHPLPGGLPLKSPDFGLSGRFGRPVVNVTVHNGGDMVAAGSTVSVTSLFIAHVKKTIPAARLPLILLARGSKALPEVDPGESVQLAVRYTSFEIVHDPKQLLKPRPEKLRPKEVWESKLNLVGNAVVATKIRVKQADNEVMTSNNSAVDIRSLEDDLK